MAYRLLRNNLQFKKGQNIMDWAREKIQGHPCSLYGKNVNTPLNFRTVRLTLMSFHFSQFSNIMYPMLEKKNSKPLREREEKKNPRREWIIRPQSRRNQLGPTSDISAQKSEGHRGREELVLLCDRIGFLHTIPMKELLLD